MPTDLTTLPDEDLRQLAILGVGLQKIDAARAYGFIEGGPEIVDDRIDDVLAVARERGLTWTDEEVTDSALAYIAQANAEADERKTDG